MFSKKKKKNRWKKKKKRSEMKTRKEATEYSEEQREIACENSRFYSLTQEGRAQRQKFHTDDVNHNIIR